MDCYNPSIDSSSLHICPKVSNMKPIASVSSALLASQASDLSSHQQGDQRRTRADLIRAVNLELLPLSHLIFLYCPLLGLLLWLYVCLFPYFYIHSCEQGMYISAHVIYGLLAGASFVFEMKVSKRIVAVIEPLSGKRRLSNFQTLRLVIGQLGRLDIYTNFCFVVICFECQSRFAYYALAIRILSSSVLVALQVKTILERNVISLQLLEFTTLFDLLGKYQIMYIEGEKSSELLRAWVKTGSVLPLFKFFVDDIGQFVIQLLFLIEQGQLKLFVCVSLCISIVFSFLSVLMVYLKYTIFTPNMVLEEELVHTVRLQLQSHNFEAVKNSLSDKKKFRKFAGETRSEVLKLVAVSDFDLFVYLVEYLISTKSDALLNNEVLHEKLLQSLRMCRKCPETVLKALAYLRDTKNVFIDFTKRLSISNEGGLLHCLLAEPHFLLRNLQNGTYDLIEFAIEQGATVDDPDKFGETPTTLAAKLNFQALIRSTSSKTLRELFSFYNITLGKEEVDLRIKEWAYGLVVMLVSHGVSLKHRNKKGRTAVEIAKEAGNVVLAHSLERMMKSSFLSPDTPKIA